MKKIYLFALGVVASSVSFAQTTFTDAVIQGVETEEVLPKMENRVSSSRGTEKVNIACSGS